MSNHSNIGGNQTEEIIAADLVFCQILNDHEGAEAEEKSWIDQTDYTMATPTTAISGRILNPRIPVFLTTSVGFLPITGIRKARNAHSGL
jgi:hypothetical protein